MNIGYAVKFRNRANADFLKAYNWYEDQQKGLGERFFKAIVTKSNVVATDPYMFKTIVECYHEVLIDTFPYLLIYTVKEQKREIIIMAIFHTSRNPRSKYRK